MQTLDAYNLMLAYLGLPPISSIDTQDSEVVILQSSLRRAKERVLREAWRVFGNEVKLTPNNEGKIDLKPYIRIVYPPQLRRRITVRNGFAWDIEKNTYFNEDIDRVFVVDNIDFDNIGSDEWQEYIAFVATQEAMLRINSVDADYAELDRQKRLARARAHNQFRPNVDNTFGITQAMYGFYQ